ncbi:ABC transporter permease [Propionicicella superfundia]|uniref:ABC transporter permease n=1 Tax=Propionicicella superfundia TaxID=348582 RepID=UPI0004227F47|nr:ABC transporter permease [Propionicicella superfundia]
MQRVAQGLAPYTLPMVAVVAWWLVTALGLVPAAALPSPGRVAGAAWRMTASGELPRSLAASLARVAIGGLAGAVAGVALGVASGLSRAGQTLLDRPLQMLRMVPFNAMVPLFILFLGIGEPMRLFVVAWAVAFPLYINTFAGIRDVDSRLVEMARVYRVPRARIARDVLLRGALPSVLTGLRFSLGLAWIALIYIEVVNAGTGLGYQLSQAQQFTRIDVILVILGLYGILGGLTDWFVRLLEHRLLHWRAAYTGD